MKLPTPIFILTMLIILIGGLTYLIDLHFNLNYQSPQAIFTAYKPVTQEKQGLILNLSNSDEAQLVFQPDFLLQGKTSPNAVVILSVGDSDQVLTVSPRGDFSATVKLKEKLNLINIFALDNLGNSKQSLITIFYTPDKL